MDRLGYSEVTERLTADLNRYPPPVSLDPARHRENWSRSTVQDLLRNPKYTGYMVWNGGRLSRRPIFPSPRFSYEEANLVAMRRRRRRGAWGSLSFQSHAR